MSDSNQAKSPDRQACRDYERGVCNRGSKCKFFHPADINPTANGKLPICKDYQNKNCFRAKCKFLHITVDEEAEYNVSGVLPAHGGRLENMTAANMAGGRAAPQAAGQPEVCKDFLNNMCNRGNRCKFAHVSEMESRTFPIETIGMAGAPALYGKRQRADGFEGMTNQSSAALAEENEMLKRKITELQREVIDLRQMNDTLYEQNTKYRTQLRSSTLVDNQSFTTKLAPAATMAPSTDMMSNRLAYSYGYSQYLH